MIWTYRVFRDGEGRYSVREVFYEQDGKIITYGKTPVALVGASLAEIMQLVGWFKDAFDLPVLSMEEVDSEIATQSVKVESTHSRGIPLKEVLAELSDENEPTSAV